MLDFFGEAIHANFFFLFVDSSSWKGKASGFQILSIKPIVRCRTKDGVQHRLRHNRLIFKRPTQHCI